MSNRIDKYIPDYVVYDLETTGTSTKNDKIIEISALKVKDHKVVEEFSTLVNPEMPIPFYATQINNITDEMVEKAPTIEEVLPNFLAFIDGQIIMGQNIARFDNAFIQRECQKLLGKSFAPEYMDTLPLARMCLPELPNHKMETLAKHFGISTTGAHRALADCYMTQQVYEKIGPMIDEKKTALPKCPKCGNVLKKRNGKFGEFWGCSGYPDCRYTKNI